MKRVRTFTRSTKSGVITVALFTALALLIALPMQDAFNQVKIASANDELQNFRVVELSQTSKEQEEELKRWRTKFEAEVAAVFTDKKAEDWQQFIRMAQAIAPIYDYPVKVLVAQAALESARGTSRWAVERNNFFGYRCYDNREYEMCSWFTSPYEGMIEYIRLIRDKYPEAYALRKDPDAMIKAIKAGGYATDPLYVTKVMSMPEWSKY